MRAVLEQMLGKGGKNVFKAKNSLWQLGLREDFSLLGTIILRTQIN